MPANVQRREDRAGDRIGEQCAPPVVGAEGHPSLEPRDQRDQRENDRDAGELKDPGYPRIDPSADPLRIGEQRRCIHQCDDRENTAAISHDRRQDAPVEVGLVGAPASLMSRPAQTRAAARPAARPGTPPLVRPGRSSRPSRVDPAGLPPDPWRFSERTPLAVASSACA